MYTDEVWAMEEAHTKFYITVKENDSDQYLSENLQHKYSKRPGWMFFECIVEGKKEPGIFWEKE